MRILFNSKDPRHKIPFGTLLPGEACRMRVDIPASVRTLRAALVLEKEDGAEYARFRMEKSGGADGYEFFSVEFSLPAPGLFFYYFRIETPNEAFSLFRQDFDQTNMEAGEKWQLSCTPAFDAPGDFKGGVMMQIFPDRFFKKGEPDLTGKLRPFSVHENPLDLPEYAPDETGEVKNCDFFGGNLAGIESKLDDLRELGVRILYLNPIFKAWSNHRYDTADYKKIDEMLGTEEDLRSLCRAAHERGMKIVLDGVFSHTGSRSLYFDEKEEFGSGALHHADSPYRAWYDLRPDGTCPCWWGVKTLPCVKETEPSYLDFIIDGEDSVIAHWLRAGADGFRLDVADELPDAFIARLRRRLKEWKPDAILIGEVWEDASNKKSYGVRRRYFVDGELDSVMNYPWRGAILDLLRGKTDPEGFRRSVTELCENYPPAVHHTLMNFLSTHDTARVFSALSPVDPPAEKDARARWRVPEEARAETLARVRAAAFLQFALPGMPCIYYGDEIGMEGLEDPFCRAFYRWDLVEKNPLREHYKSLAALRAAHPALKKGDLAVSLPAPGVLALARAAENETVTAFFSLSPEPVALPLDGAVLLSENARADAGDLTLARLGFALVQTN